MSNLSYEQIGVAMTCRGYEEYLRMFDLTEIELKAGNVLDVAAGGSSFTAEANARGLSAQAVDPRYGAEVQEWVNEASLEIETSTAKIARLAEAFDWSYYGSVENHRKGRLDSLKLFAADVTFQPDSNRYVEGRLPQLPFEDNEFSLVLCSHFMFLYANQFGFEFHEQSVTELMRIVKPGGQIRIYPLMTLDWKPYPELDELLKHIEARGGKAELSPSRLPFIPLSNHFLKISL